MWRAWWGYVAAAVIGAALAWGVCHRVPDDAAVDDWEGERRNYLEDQRRADADTARAWAVVRAAARTRDSMAAAAAALARENARLRARRVPTPALAARPVPDTCRPVVAELVEQLAVRDSVIETDSVRIRRDSVALASFDSQLAAMTSVAVIHQVKRHEAEALLAVAPVRAVGSVRVTAAVLGEVAVDADQRAQLAALVRAGAHVRAAGPLWATAEVERRTTGEWAFRGGGTASLKLW